MKSFFASNLIKKMDEIQNITDTSPQLRNEFLNDPARTLLEFGIDSEILIDSDTGKSVRLSNLISELPSSERRRFVEDIVYKQYAGDGGDGDGDGDGDGNGDDSDDSDDADDDDDTEDQDIDVAMAVAVAVAMNVAVVAEVAVAIAAVAIIGYAPDMNADGREGGLPMECKNPIVVPATPLNFAPEFENSELHRFFNEAGLPEYRQKSLLKMAMQQLNSVATETEESLYSYAYRGKQLNFLATQQHGKVFVRSGYLGN